ncbi:MAG: hypothetical protein SGCHY_005362, partial [Lobulomycetales sp.]
NELFLEYRFLFVIPILLPASTIYTWYWTLRSFLTRLSSASNRHEENVLSIQRQIKAWRKSGSENLLCTARPSFLSIGLRNQKYKKKDNQITLRLYNILCLDTDAMTVTVEPGVNVGQLTRFLNPKGFTLPVVPELDDLTFGGLMNGYGIESSSHKYGLLNDFVVSAELVLGDASVVQCSATENPDLFRAVPWSHGSLGFLTSLTMKIIPCKPYVRLVYEPVYTLDNMCQRFGDLARGKVDPVTKEREQCMFLEAVQYDYNNGVLTYGDFADHVGDDGELNSIGLWYKPWWYKHAEKYLHSGKKTVEYIPIRDYYHRHTRSIFWEMELILPMGNHPIFRYLLGWIMPPSISFLKGTQTEYVKRHYQDMHIAQDYLLPLEYLKESITVSHELYDIYPLWLCPHAVYKTEPQGAIRAPQSGTSEADMEMYVDLGIWYCPKAWTQGRNFDGRAATREFEAWLRQHRGYQATYAVTEQTAKEYYTMFDDTLYKQVREKYGAVGVFIGSYDKIAGGAPNTES